MVWLTKGLAVAALLNSVAASACIMNWDLKGAQWGEEYGDCSCEGRLLARNVSWKACNDETKRITEAELKRQKPTEAYAKNKSTQEPKDIIENTGAASNPANAIRTMTK